VPTDISGLTRLDILLGVQLLGVCWLMAAAYVRAPAEIPQSELCSTEAELKAPTVDSSARPRPPLAGWRGEALSLS
jgi:hypothetical protein